MRNALRYEKPKLVDLAAKGWDDPFGIGQTGQVLNCPGGNAASGTCGGGNGAGMPTCGGGNHQRN
jgi:hypothetical protein